MAVARKKGGSSSAFFVFRASAHAYRFVYEAQAAHFQAGGEKSRA
jgi:hypothetical protein